MTNPTSDFLKGFTIGNKCYGRLADARIPAVISVDAGNCRFHKALDELEGAQPLSHAHLIQAEVFATSVPVSFVCHPLDSSLGMLLTSLPSRSNAEVFHDSGQDVFPNNARCIPD